MMFWTLLGAGCLSLTMTWALRRYALTRRSLIDVPNERSSHQTPTPRGGGVAIAIAFLGLLPALWVAGTLPSNMFIALGGAGALITLVGFLDDHRPVPTTWRLVAHFVAAAWVVGWLGGMPPLVFAGLHSVVRGGEQRPRRRLRRVVIEPLQLHGRYRRHCEHRSRGGLHRRDTALPHCSTGQSTLDRSGLTGGVGRRFWLLELAARPDLHGRRRQRFPRRDLGRFLGPGRLGRSRAVLGLDDSARCLHRRCERDSGTAGLARPSVRRGASHPRVPARSATGSGRTNPSAWP